MQFKKMAKGIVEITKSYILRVGLCDTAQIRQLYSFSAKRNLPMRRFFY